MFQGLCRDGEVMYQVRGMEKGDGRRLRLFDIQKGGLPQTDLTKY